MLRRVFKLFISCTLLVITCVLLSVSSSASTQERKVKFSHLPASGNIYLTWDGTASKLGSAYSDDIFNGYTAYAALRDCLREAVADSAEGFVSMLSMATDAGLPNKVNAVHDKLTMVVGATSYTGGKDTSSIKKVPKGFTLALSGWDEVVMTGKQTEYSKDSTLGITYKLGNSGETWEYLNITVGTATYTLDLGYLGDDLDRHILAALADALEDYTYIIYDYKGASSISPVSNLSMSNMELRYVISPVFGLVPWNNDWKSWLAFVNDNYDENLAIKTTAQWGSPTSNFTMRGGKVLNNVDVEALRKSLAEYDAAYVNVPSQSDGAAVVNTLSTPSFGYFSAFWFCSVNKATNRAGFFANRDWVAFTNNVYCHKEKLGTKLGVISLPSKDIPTKLFEPVTIRGSSATIEPKYFLNIMAPIVYISDWNTTDVSGIYTVDWSADAKGNASTLALLHYRESAIDTDFVRNIDLEASKLRYKFKYLTSFKNSLIFDDKDSGAYYDLDYDGDATFDYLTIDELENIKINTKTADAVYYYCVPENKIYTIENNKGYKSANASLIGLFATYTECPDLDLGSFYTISATAAMPMGDNYGLNNGISSLWQSCHAINVCIPDTYMETIRDKWVISGEDIAAGCEEDATVLFYVPTGRKIRVDLSKSTSMPMLDKNGVFAYTEGDADAMGAFFNYNGRVLVSDNTSITMQSTMLTDGAALVLCPDYIEASGLYAWLDTAAASNYMSSNVKYTGYTTDLFRKRLASDGVKLGTVDDVNDLVRLEEIANELSADKTVNWLNFVLTLIGFCGILLMVYACLLVIAFYIDLFNGITTFSILGFITLGKLKAVQSKNALDDMGITDPKERKHYVTRFSIIGRWALAMGFGLLLFASNQVYVWILQLFTWLSELFGI